MAAVGQDFNVYAGAGANPQFGPVTTDDGSIYNLALVDDIIWAVSRDADSTVVITKMKSTGGIVFASDGTDGIFIVNISGSDTTSLSSYFIHAAYIIDSTGEIIYVTTGRFQVLPKPTWTYSGDPTLSPKDAVRFLSGDIIEADQLTTDSEILFAIAQTSNIYGAAALICRAIAAKLSREADTANRDIRDAISQRARAYIQMGVRYDMQASARSGGLPYFGGISIADKTQQEANTDRVQPSFTIGMDDNLIPVGPVGPETPSSAR